MMFYDFHGVSKNFAVKTGTHFTVAVHFFIPSAHLFVKYFTKHFGGTFEESKCFLQ